RESDDSRYVSLALPHILMRDPYGPDTKPVEGLNFVEDVDGKDHKKYLWGNAAYALGTRITSAFATSGWTAAIRGVEGGGLVENLPV
ncbi:type VI secretion system contractile sheath domain-containing protein, partial [Salmonella enterica]|uniref:type VI secretion system contractile sheath domain-containing protein n=1 Tax=Salmonella enterica TaxID=28901 RepID=UPI003D26B1D3